jgi:hypothetical protein
MAAPKPKARYITELLLSLLADIVAGDDYHYTPDSVFDHYAFTPELMNTTDSCFYVVSPDDQVDEELTYTDTEGLRRYDLTLARKLVASTENPWTRTAEDEIRGDVQDRMVADAKKAIRGSKTLVTDDYPSGVALIVSCPLAEMAAEDTFYPGNKAWVLAYVRVEVHFEFPDAEPGVAA